jgi:hypothetical protein
LLAASGIIVGHETMRQWAQIRPGFANQIRRRLPRVGDKWHFDEVALGLSLKPEPRSGPPYSDRRGKKPVIGWCIDRS